MAIDALLPSRRQIGSGRSTTCGKRSAIANSSSTSKPLALDRRLLVVNGSLTSKPLAPARRLLVVYSSLTSKPLALDRRQLVANSSLPSKLLAPARRPPADRPPEPSSCGFAAAASTSDSPARPPGDSSVRPLSLVCDTSKNALSEQRWLNSSVLRLPRHVRRHWPMRWPSSAFVRRWRRRSRQKRPTIVIARR
jgi:hypothetical protein